MPLFYSRGKESKTALLLVFGIYTLSLYYSAIPKGEVSTGVPVWCCLSVVVIVCVGLSVGQSVGRSVSRLVGQLVGNSKED